MSSRRRHELPVVCLRLLLFLVILGVQLSGIVCFAKVTLVENGRALAVVVIADDASLTARHAAGELTNHIHAATGTLLPVVTESKMPGHGRRRVYVGNTEAARRNGFNPDAMQVDAYRLRVIDQDLYVLGREAPLPDESFDFIRHQSHPNGTLFGIYEVLDRYVGTRWLWPGRLGTYTPKTNAIVIPATLDEMHEPVLQFRHFRTAGILTEPDDALPAVRHLAFSRETHQAYVKDLSAYLGRHRVGGGNRKPRVGHYFNDWWEEVGDRYPEWFMMQQNGVRGPVSNDVQQATMCVSNADLHRYIVREAWEGGDTLRLGEVNQRSVCLCDACLNWDGPQPDNPPEFAARDFDPRMVSDRYARFWKTIHAMASARNPDVTVTTFLYYNYFPAPTGDIRLNANIYGEFVPWGSRYELFPMPASMEQWLREQWSGWRQTGISMAFRPNYLMLGYVMPHLSTWQVGEFIQYAARNGMQGFDQASLVGHWAVQGPMLYMHMRLAWKPEMAIKNIRQEYFSAFGPAAPIVEQYFDYWEAYSLERPGGNLRNPIYAVLAYPPEVFEPAQAMLEDAKTAVSDHPDDEYGQRVQFLAAGLEHARLAARFMATLYDGNVSWRPERFEISQQALNELIDFRRRHEHLYIANLLHAARQENRWTEVEYLVPR